MAEEVQSQSHGRSSDSDEDLELYTATGDLFGRLGSRRRRKLRARWMRSHSRKATRAAKREFERLDWEKHVDFLTAREFRRYYKLSKESFHRTCTRLLPHLRKHKPNASNDAPVSARIQLAVTIRWLAGGNYLDIMYVHRISSTSFWHAVHVVIHALLVEYGTDELGVDKFKDPDWLRSTEKTFAKHTGGAIRNCVFAIDGMAVKIQKPTPKECSNPMSY